MPVIKTKGGFKCGRGGATVKTKKKAGSICRAIHRAKSRRRKGR